MMFRHRLALPLAVISVGCTAFAAQEIDLESAIDFALRQNRNLKLTELSLDRQELSLQQARTEFSPRFKPLGEASRRNDGGTTKYGISASKKLTLGTELGMDADMARQEIDNTPDYHRGSVRVSLTQPLLKQFGILVNREPVTRAENSVMASRRDFELRKTDLIVDVVDSYERVLRLQEQAAFDEQSLARLERLQRLTTVKERQGSATRVDVLRVELQYSEAESRVGRTRESLASARAELADLLGMPVETELAAMPTDMPAVDVPAQEDAGQIALANRLDYAQVLQDREDAARGVRIARRNLLPDLNLTSRYETYGEGETSGDARSLDEDIWFVGLSASVDLNRSSDRLAFRQSTVGEASAVQNVAILESSIRRQVRQSVLAYEQAQADAVFAERNHQLAQDRAQLARRLYEMGRGDNFTVTDAESALQESQNRMLAAQSEAVLAAYRLLRTLGLLLEYPEDLKPRDGDNG